MGVNKNITVSRPNTFPLEWASDWGQDEYGLWMSFTLNNKVGQRFRWINPGSFLMGSPEEEAERSDDETLHAVELTRGYWLAETACTQALWQVIMGKSPSDFEGKERPVENVSWNDVDTFLTTVNKLHPDLKLRLPTEAEWEYACRAGTTTPFSFGENISTDQVNYDGNYPYHTGQKGEYRQKTITVGSLPCNPWGLYEMHGNVYEWCADWYGPYPDETVVDPKGPEKGVSRVLRGGSWSVVGRCVRSAYRRRTDPSDRHDSIGFRLARGQ